MNGAGGPVVAVGAVIVVDGSLLMIRRGHAPARGRWSLPGGRVEPGETLEAALVREVREETALDIEVQNLLGVLEVPADDHHFVILDYAATVVGDFNPVAGGDADDVRWVSLDDVPALDCTPRFVETLRGWGVLPAGPARRSER
ncbi:MAG TPA: NUDIX domain-containing protein [Actinomycetota bacterium]|nr:NUDIX domain-containing protein [Actinomycetota bacterium]